MATPGAFASTSAPASTRSSSASSKASSHRKSASLPAISPATWKTDGGQSSTAARQSSHQPIVNLNIDPMPMIRSGFYTVETVIMPASDQQHKTPENCYASIAHPNGAKYKVPLVRANGPLPWIPCRDFENRVTTSIFDALRQGGFSFREQNQWRNFDCTSGPTKLIFSKSINGGTGAVTFKAWLQGPPSSNLQPPLGAQTAMSQSLSTSSSRLRPQPAPKPAQGSSLQPGAQMPLPQAIDASGLPVGRYTVESVFMATKEFKRQSEERSSFMARDGRGTRLRVKMADIDFVIVKANGYTTASLGDAAKKGGFPQGEKP